MRKVLILVIISLISLSFAFEKPVVSFEREEVEVLLNTETEVNVSVSNVSDLYGFSFHIEYEPENLDVLSVEAGDFFEGKETIFLSKIDKERREIVVGDVIKGKDEGVSGSGILLKIKFVLKEDKETYLKFKKSVLKDSNLSVIDTDFKDVVIKAKKEEIPIISVEPEELVFTSVGELKEIKIKNIGEGTLKGTITPLDEWIVVKEREFEGDTTVVVTVVKESDKEGSIKIESNGGNYTVKVKFKKPEEVKKIIKLQIGNQTAYVNDEPKLLEFPPFIENDRTMVPLRFIAEERGAKVLWFADESKAVVVYKKIFIELWVDQGKDYIRVNGKFYKVDVAPYTYHDRTVVPVRFFAEFMNGKVDWIEETQTVIITFTG